MFGACRVQNSLVAAWAASLAVIALGLPAKHLLGQAPGSGYAPAYENNRAAYDSNRYPLREMTGQAPPRPQLRPQPSQPPNREENAPELVAGVRITGNRSISNDRIFSHLSTRPDREFDPEWLEADKRALMRTGLFRDVDIYTQRNSAGVVVTFHVYELPIIGYLKFIGNRAITDKTLRKETGLEQGQALSLYRIKDARQKIEDYYRSKGYTKTEVTILEGDRSEDLGVVMLISEDGARHIWHVEFVGNNIATDGRLKTQIRSKPPLLRLKFLGGKIDRQKIDEDVQRLTAYYRSLGYFNATIGREINYNSGGWATLTFYINEGPRYVVRNVSIYGNHKFENDSLMDELKLKPGDFFNAAKMGADVNMLKDLYGSEGHVFADIRPETQFFEDPGQLDLVYNVNQGEQYRVGRIDVRIAGQFPHTRERVVRNRISLVPGEVIDIRKIRASEIRLMRSQLFVNEPHRGVAPQIVVRPPDPDTRSNSVAESPRESSDRSDHRGQSPDPSPASRQTHDDSVNFVPPAYYR